MPEFGNTLGFGNPSFGEIGFTGTPASTTGAGIAGNIASRGASLAGAPSMVGALVGPTVATGIDYATTPTYGFSTNPVSVGIHNSILGPVTDFLGLTSSLQDQVNSAWGAQTAALGAAPPGSFNSDLMGTVDRGEGEAPGPSEGAPSTGQSASPGVGGWGADYPGGMGNPGGNAEGGPGGSGDGGSGSMICTELYTQGLLPQRIWLEDQAYGFVLAIEDPAVVRGYHLWARPVVRAMQKSRAATKAASWLAIPWARHVAGDKNRIGAFLMRFGVPACRFIGRFVGDSVEKAKTA